MGGGCILRPFYLTRDSGVRLDSCDVCLTTGFVLSFKSSCLASFIVWFSCTHLKVLYVVSLPNTNTKLSPGHFYGICMSTVDSLTKTFFNLLRLEVFPRISRVQWSDRTRRSARARKKRQQTKPAERPSRFAWPHAK